MPSKHWTIDQIADICDSKKFTSQEKLFTYIASENAKILASSSSQLNHQHYSSSVSAFGSDGDCAGGGGGGGLSFSASHQYLSSSGDLVLPSSSGRDASSATSIFASSSSSGVGGSSLSSGADDGGVMSLMMMGGGGGGASRADGGRMGSNTFSSSSHHDNQHRVPIQQQLLRPFCVHVSPLSAANVAAMSEIPGNNTSSVTGTKSRDRANSFFAMSHYADVTNVSRLQPMAPHRREREDSTSSGRTSIVVNSQKVAHQQQQPQPSKEQQDECPLQQTRFFLAMTSDHFFNRVVRSPRFPHPEQHFFEIIQENSPCVMYFDVEMEHDHGLTKAEHDDLKEQVLQWLGSLADRTAYSHQASPSSSQMYGRPQLQQQQQQQQLLFVPPTSIQASQQQKQQQQHEQQGSSPRGGATATVSSISNTQNTKRVAGGASSSSSSSSSGGLGRYQVPKAVRVKQRCCPVDCHIEFDPSTTRDVMIAELKHFINEVFQLPLEQQLHKSSCSESYAKLTDACFRVLVSSTPSATKFSQHYIIRFTDDTVRFANNNLDVKIVVYHFVQYLYQRAVEDPKVHAALFYHESVQRRKCSVTIPSSSSSSSSCSAPSLSPPPFSSSASQASLSSSYQQSVVASSSSQIVNDMVSADYTVPAIALGCIIDEAVYSRNRMMRCYGSCKVGKAAVLEFDEPWHHTSGKGCPVTDQLYQSTLISDPLVLAPSSSATAATSASSSPQKSTNSSSIGSASSSSFSSGATTPFKIIDSDRLAAYAIASGNTALVPACRGGGAGGGATVTVPHMRSGGGSGSSSTQQSASSAAFSAQHDTTICNSVAATMKLPMLCKEICDEQSKMDRTVTRGSIVVENLQIHFPKVDDDQLKRTNAMTLMVTCKIRGSRWCYVVKRPHRSNGVFWVVKYYARDNYATLEQRCFDDDCKNKFKFSTQLSEATCCELKVFTGNGLSPWLQPQTSVAAAAAGHPSRSSSQLSSMQQCHQLRSSVVAPAGANTTATTPKKRVTLWVDLQKQRQEEGGNSSPDAASIGDGAGRSSP